MTVEPPLKGVRVLDLSSLLPGPLASLILADAGADVVKVERSGPGDEVRSYRPAIGGTSAIYTLLNRGKRSFSADLRAESDRDRVLRLAASAHVVIEQFRPGVAERLGVDFATVSSRNPKVVYCSITGYGQTGPLRSRAGHDLNYLAQSGLLSLVTDVDGAPYLPVTNIADIAGGSFPAALNILLGLRRSEATGVGCHLDISMTHNLQVLAFASLAAERAGQGWPTPDDELLTGRSPRYNIYPTSDGRHLAVAALEQKFWMEFTALIELADEYRQDVGNERRVIDAVRERIARMPSTHWRSTLEPHDVCATIVDTFAEAAAAGLITSGHRRIKGPDHDVSALHSPVTSELLGNDDIASAPVLKPLPADISQLWA